MLLFGCMTVECAERSGHLDDWRFWLILVAFIICVAGGGWLLKKLGGPL